MKRKSHGTYPITLINNQGVELNFDIDITFDDGRLHDITKIEKTWYVRTLQYHYPPAYKFYTKDYTLIFERYLRIYHANSYDIIIQKIEL